MKAHATNPTPAKETQGEYARTTDFMRRLVAVPRETLQRKLEAEKRAKESSSSRNTDASEARA